MSEPIYETEDVAQPGRERPPRYALEPVARLLLYLFVIAFGLVLAAVVVLPLVLVLGVTPADIYDFQSNLPLVTAYYLAAAAVALVVSYGFVLFLERLPAGALGLSRQGSWQREMWFGVLLGFLGTGLIFAVAYAAGWTRVTGSMLVESPRSVVLTLVGTVLLMGSISVAEETMMRGYTLRTLKWGYGAVPALIVSSVLFSLLHFLNPGAALPGFVGTMAAGLVLGYGYLVTGRLWLPIGLHFGWNFCLGPVFGFPVSGVELDSWVRQVSSGSALWLGGGFGPEAGILSLIAMAAIALGIRWFGRRLYEPGDGGSAVSGTAEE